MFMCVSMCQCDYCVCVCVQLAEAASQLEGPLTFLSWRDHLQRLAWCVRFAEVTKRSE